MKFLEWLKRKLRSKKTQQKKDLDDLLQLLLLCEKKRMLDEAARATKREENRKKANQSLEERIKARQAKCDHLKNHGKGVPPKELFTPSARSPKKNYQIEKDYLISDHTFIDNSRVIKCLKCGKTWTPDGPDWEFALMMTKNTTNDCTASEHMITMGVQS